MTELDSDLPMNRILTDKTLTKIKGAYRQTLYAPGSDIEETELADGLPLSVDVLLIRRFEETGIHVAVLLDQEKHLELTTDDVEDCSLHTEGESLSTLADLGEEYADLKQDLLEVSALMCDLPEFEEELQRYVTDQVAFQNLSCYDGLLTFTFAFHVADIIVEAYQDFEHKLGEQIGIPIEPSVDEIVGDGTDE